MVDNFELLDRVRLGENDTRLPFAFWQHFPKLDLSAKPNSDAHVRFCEATNPILLKYSFNSRYSVLDYGGEIDEFHEGTGSATLKQYPLDQYGSWENLPIRDELGEFEVDSIDGLRKTVGRVEGTPVIATIFSPLMTMSKVGYGLDLTQECSKPGFAEVFEDIVKTTTEFAKSALDAGAHGLFLASQHLVADGLGDKHRLKFEHAELRKLLALAPRSSILHVHGDHPLVVEAGGNNPAFLNWHDQCENAPSISDVYSKTKKHGFIGGISTEKVPEQTLDELVDQAKTHWASEYAHRFIYGPGCVIPLSVGTERLILLSKALSKLQ